jgi:hypothetical protein
MPQIQPIPSAELTISRVPFETALEQPQLYAIGLEAIRQRAGRVWTDHNVHDPGVTVIEILSYVATDLALRASFHVEDLLAVETDNAARMRERFSSARVLLTNRPLTIRDYRKLMIDLPGVRNAWLYPEPLTYYAVSDNNERRLFAADPGVPGTVAVVIRGLYQVLIDFTDAANTIDKQVEVLRAVRAVLHANRNLCEDFLEPVGVERQEFQICGELELEAGRDVDVSAIEAEIFFRVQQLLAPSVANYSLAEMLQARNADGSLYQVEEIFDGPRLRTGFIKDDEVDAANLPTAIRLSDVINVVMDIEGVRAIRDLLITPRGATTMPDKWVVPVDPRKQPTLARDTSRLVYYKSEVPVSPIKATVEARYKDVSEKATAKLETQRIEDWPIPLGRPRDAGSYYSLQNHFPQTYGIGEAGLDPAADTRRQALARQLKAYLLFFDQILADFCAQLDRFGDLFSIDPAMEKTYFYQAVDTLREFEAVYDVTPDPGLDKPAARAAARQLVLDLLRTNVDESVDVHEDRRHRFLDHLIARYGEQFHEYADAVQAALGASSRTLRRHKCRFLGTYPEMGGDRGGSYDDTVPATSLWDSTSVSGLERRLCLLLDMTDAGRRDMSTVPKDANANIVDLGPGDRRFQITNEAGDAVLLEAPFGFATAADAKAGMDRALETAQVPSAYVRQLEADGTGSFTIVDAGGQTVARSGGHFKDAAALEMAIDDCLEFVRRHYGREGLFVIENFLLRSTVDAHLLRICGNADCDGCADDDPYSYRIHVILPADAGRFTSMAFREFVESVIRAETPAHILPKVCWIGREDQQRLDQAYRAWITAGPDAEASGALERLRDVLESVKNVYPQAKLADCESPEGMPKFLLGRRALGDAPADE